MSAGPTEFEKDKRVQGGVRTGDLEALGENEKIFYKKQGESSA